jgi:hypothetical protein
MLKVLDADETSSLLKNIADFLLLDMASDSGEETLSMVAKETGLSLRRYLTFCTEMRPYSYNIDQGYWSGFPFYSKDKYPHVDHVLKMLEIHPHAQYSQKVREQLQVLCDRFQYPFAMDPLTIGLVKLEFYKLQKLTAGSENFKSFTEKNEEFIRAHAGKIGAAGATLLAAGLTYYAM